MIKIGIDPGWSGSCVVKYPDDKIVCFDCPDTQSEIVEIVKDIKNMATQDLEDVVCVIEKVHSMPGQNCAALWKFAVNFATWQTALIAFGIPFTEVTPQAWQKKLGGCPKDKGDRKRYIKDCMQKKYPMIKVTLNNADALAILSVCYE